MQVKELALKDKVESQLQLTMTQKHTNIKKRERERGEEGYNKPNKLSNSTCHFFDWCKPVTKSK